MKKQDIQRHLQVALKKSPYRGNIRRISLFGSHLHGTAKKTSDVDLLIEFKEPISMFALIDIEEQLSKALGRHVDLCTPKSLSRYFRNDVMREADPLFEVPA